MKGTDTKLNKLKKKVPTKLHYNAYIQANWSEVTYAQNTERNLRQTKFKLKGKGYPTELHHNTNISQARGNLRVKKQELEKN